MLDKERKKQTVKLGIRISLVFLIVFCILIFGAYHVLSGNFQKLLTQYTIELMQTMVDEGVTIIESDLNACMAEAAVLADSLQVGTDGDEIAFPVGYLQSDVLRMVYVTGHGSNASDGRKRDINGRTDIEQAWNGESAVYGPYFNEEDEYVICYSTPVYRDGAVCGVLSVEKDGYRLCELIRGIAFVRSGEAYIIDETGTDIAVSSQEHISWVDTRYNAEEILKDQEDPVTRSVFELEQKGLGGSSGVGTYEWSGSTCYLAYAPIPSEGWVLLAGLREEEIAAMTRSTLYASFTGAPAYSICIAVLLLIAAVIYWIVSGMKENSRMTERLNIIANYDSLTGIGNRNSYLAAVKKLSEQEHDSLACIYIDVNGLHEINNHLGHLAGDEMLKTVANVLQYVFSENEAYRIGGDEFVVFCENLNQEEIYGKAEEARNKLREHEYEISIGIEWRAQDQNVNTMTILAEEAMQRDKRQFYHKHGKERQMRTLDQKLEQMVLEKREADVFLSVLAPEFKGVYFVNMDHDTLRHLYIPPYFEEILRETGDIFSRALALYIDRFAAVEFQPRFRKFCDYDWLEVQLDENSTLEFIYQRKDGVWLKLRVLKFKAYTASNREILWIFSTMEDAGQQQRE